MADNDNAVSKALEQNDVQSIFFVNFSEPLEGSAVQAQQNLQSSIDSWQAWASTVCEGRVQQQVKESRLPGDYAG